MIGFAAAIGIVIAWWAWRLAGPIASVFAVAAFCFDPNFSPTDPSSKTTSFLALSFLFFAASVWLLGERLTPMRIFAVGLFMGLAFMVKFSGLLVIPMLAVLLVVRSVIPIAWPAGPFSTDNIDPPPGIVHGRVSNLRALRLAFHLGLLRFPLSARAGVLQANSISPTTSAISPTIRPSPKAPIQFTSAPMP